MCAARGQRCSPVSPLRKCLNNFLGHSHSTISFQSPIKNSSSASVSSRSHTDRSVKSGGPGLDKGANINMGGSMDSGGLRPPHDQGETSLVFLEASMAYLKSCPGRSL